MSLSLFCPDNKLRFINAIMEQEQRRGNGQARVAESVATADRRATGSGGSSKRGGGENHGGVDPSVPLYQSGRDGTLFTSWRW